MSNKSVLTVSFIVFLCFAVGAAFASTTMQSASLNGQSQVTVSPGASIAASLTVRLTHSSFWSSTAYQIGNGEKVCIDTPSHSLGTFSESFTVTAPDDAGAYNVTFWTYSNDACSIGESVPMKLTNGIIIIETNPELSSSCGIDIVLIIDSSGSIDATELTQMQDAFKGFVDAFLPNTPTQVAVVDFDTVARMNQYYSTDKAGTNDAIDNATSGGSTNWQDALANAYSLYQSNSRADKPDLFILASDGNPNKYGNPAQGVGSDVDPSALSAAIVTANEIKSSGVRIITLGIGDGLKPENLKAISSEDAYYSTNFDQLAQTLADMAGDLCGGTISVKKLVNGQPADGWTFTTSVTGGTSNPPSSATDALGFVVFDISGATPSVDITETQKDGYNFFSAQCKKGDQVVGTSGTGMVTGIPVGDKDVIYCEFQNACSLSNTEDPRCYSCGNGRMEGAEVCDGNSQTCIENGYSGTQACNDDCSGWKECITTESCGNDALDGNEVCDGNSQTCLTSEGYIGTQSCNSECSGWNECTTTEVCGDGIMNGNEACDGGSQCCTTPDGYQGTQSCSFDCSGWDACVSVEGCGDGIVNGNEACDGNSQSCDMEGYSGTLSCNTDCTGWNTCLSVESCGDGIVNGLETCDDSNTVSEDGCSSVCQIETGYNCSSNPINCTPLCEQSCLNGGTCTAPNTCSCTDGWYGSDCSQTQCGDGVVNGLEVCDDGAYNGQLGHCNSQCTGQTTAPQNQGGGGGMYVACTENWTCIDWSACAGGIQTRTCKDSNKCNTIKSRPALNQTCSGTTGGSIICTANWTCTKWTDCLNGTQTRTCTDFNNCNATADKPVETQECIVPQQSQQSQQPNQSSPTGFFLGLTSFDWVSLILSLISFMTFYLLKKKGFLKLRKYTGWINYKSLNQKPCFIK